MPISTLGHTQSKTPSDYENIDESLPSGASQAALVENEAQQAERGVYVNVEEEPTTRA
jgi:hypothetical protein